MQVLQEEVTRATVNYTPSMFYKYICFVLCLAHFSYCANILVLNAAVSYSHQITFAPLWTELSLRGHNLTVLTANPINDPKLTNLTELDMKWAYKFSSNCTYQVENKISMWNYHQLIFGTMYRICDFALSSDVVLDLFQNDCKFDLVIVEYLCPQFLAFADLYNCPKILIASMNVPSIYSDLIGDITHPVLHPEFITAYHGKLSFKERVVSTLVSWYLYYVFVVDTFPKIQSSVQKYFNSTSTIPELISGVDMVFLHVNPLIQGPKAIGPTTITIGGLRKDLSKQSIPSNMKEFLDDAKEGCIYVSLGTNVNSSDLSQLLLKNIKDALGEVPYKVLWKFEAYAADMPKNIRTAKWMPQQKVLNHPNVKLFIFQGGVQSMEESIHGEVPFIVIPFFADQYQNAKILENKGVAIILDRRNLKKNELKKAILKVMNDPKYRTGVKKLKRLILDAPMSGMEKAVWWTEYVIRNKGAKHLRNPAADLPFYQYYLIDVISFLIGITILSITVTMLTLTRLYKLIRKYYLAKQKTQ